MRLFYLPSQNAQGWIKRRHHQAIARNNSRAPPSTRPSSASSLLLSLSLFLLSSSRLVFSSHVCCTLQSHLLCCSSHYCVIPRPATCLQIRPNSRGPEPSQIDPGNASYEEGKTQKKTGGVRNRRRRQWKLYEKEPLPAAGFLILNPAIARVLARFLCLPSLAAKKKLS
jgi:hypothetical protein